MTTTIDSKDILIGKKWFHHIAEDGIFKAYHVVDSNPLIIQIRSFDIVIDELKFDGVWSGREIIEVIEGYFKEYHLPEKGVRDANKPEWKEAYKKR
jgi:hypothetical protein